MAKSKNKTPSEFNASSTRHCDVCDIEVRIGFGGESNWAAHTASTAHKRNKQFPRSKNTSITSFFPKPGPSHTSTRSLLSTSIPRLKSTLPTTSSSEPVPTIEEVEEPVIFSFDDLSTPLVARSRNSCTSIENVRELARGLLPTVPLAAPGDWIASFASEPHWDVLEHESAWEMMEAVLNHAIGYNATTEDVSRLIRRGDLGVEALCSWLEKCVGVYRVEECLFEKKLDRICDALRSLGATPRAVDLPTAMPANATAPAPIPLPVTTPATPSNG
ncbi:hypothetical protein DXG01_010891 [Tephrocybe rancida]|nr:hypothetical protein DXG01_010891 [Tephrocybe rancida]